MRNNQKIAHCFYKHYQGEYEMNCDMCKVIEEIKKNENPWFVKELKTGYVIFGWNQHFHGYVIFICKQHVTEIWELEEDFRKQYLNEMTLVAKAVKEAFGAEKMNYECLGNGDVHLHFICSHELAVIWVSTAITEKVLCGGCRKKLCGTKTIFRI